MTKEEIWGNIEKLSDIRASYSCFDENERPYYYALSAGIKCIKALAQEPCEDTVSRKDVHDMLENLPVTVEHKWFNWLQMACVRLADLPPVTPVPKTKHCKDCKQWKDSDGIYRRGVGAESQCPINRKEVYEGNGYCFLFEPQEREENNADSN